MGNENVKSKIELLAPCGNFQAFIGAMNAGADAVYLGADKFGARAFAQNFTDEEIYKAIKFAHVLKRKVFITINTLIKEREFSECMSYVKKYSEMGVDAFIVQDLGLMTRIINEFPQTPVHVSTQGFTTGINSALYYKNLGAKRIVLARELSLKEIKNIKNNVNIELEVFIHGSMCYCYSGQCLLSSTLGGRSGNRGRCAGPCRHSYIPIIEGKEYPESYCMSMKDQCTLSILDKIIDLGVDSLKIEGRMKKPEYSAFVTSIYRKYIDMYYKKGKIIIEEDDYERLSKVYQRSEIQTGYFERKNGREMISIESPSYNKTDDLLLEKIRNEFLVEIKKNPLDVFFYAKADEPMMITMTCEDKSFTYVGSICESAKNKPVSVSDVRKQIDKMKEYPFYLEDFICEMEDEVFIPVREINELRRKCLEGLLNEF